MEGQIKMKIIKLCLDYKCYPIFIREENEAEEDNNLPEEDEKDPILLPLMKDIQQKYDACFINNERESDWKGFKTKEEAEAFIEELKEFSRLIKERYGEDYIINDMFPQDFEYLRKII